MLGMAAGWVKSRRGAALRSGREPTYWVQEVSGRASAGLDPTYGLACAESLAPHRVAST